LNFPPKYKIESFYFLLFPIIYPTHQTVIPFALQFSVVPEVASGCSVKALPAWSWHRAYMDVFTASFDGHPEAEFSSTMSIIPIA